MKLTHYEIKPGSAGVRLRIYITASTLAEAAELVTALSAGATPIPTAEASPPPVVSAAKKPNAPKKSTRKKKKAEAAPPPAPASAPTPDPEPAPIPEAEAAALQEVKDEVAGSLSPEEQKLMGMKSFREVMAWMVKHVGPDAAAITAKCEALRDVVPAISRCSGPLDDRVTRALPTILDTLS